MSRAEIIAETWARYHAGDITFDQAQQAIANFRPKNPPHPQTARVSRAASDTTPQADAGPVPPT